MSSATRRAILGKIEALRGTKVLSYVTGDRAPAKAQIGDDAVRPLYEHLRRIDSTKKLDFVIYSRGGAIDVPWRINTALRTVGKHWTALIAAGRQIVDDLYAGAPGCALFGCAGCPPAQLGAGDRHRQGRVAGDRLLAGVRNHRATLYRTPPAG